MIARVPSADVEVPRSVVSLAKGRPLRPVWRNELGGLTFEIGTETGRWFVKWAPAACGLDLHREMSRLRWAVRFTPVPRVLDFGADATGGWLVTAGLPGDNAVSDRWKTEPSTAVTAIGRGLRNLHDRLPVDTCPFSWSAEGRVATVRQLDAAGQLDPTRWSPLHSALRREDALVQLDDVPEIDKVVVCHGDACAPNTLLTEDGTWSGHVDLGSLGLADRWADLAVATWSLDWNYGPGWEHMLLDAYGVEPDPERTAYYRLLWDLSP